MKKFLSKFIAILAICLAGLVVSEAQVAIRMRPGPPVVRARPVSPGPKYIWINGEYTWRGGQYVYADGYWAVPPPRYRYWKEGHWKKRRDGWVWMPGHWK